MFMCVSHPSGGVTDQEAAAPRRVVVWLRDPPDIDTIKLSLHPTQGLMAPLTIATRCGVFFVGVVVGCALRLCNFEPEARPIVIHPAHRSLVTPLGTPARADRAASKVAHRGPAGGAAPPATRNVSAGSDTYGECVGRAAGLVDSVTVPEDIVIAVMTTAKRHGLIEQLRETWLSPPTKALFLTDAEGLAETPTQKARAAPAAPHARPLLSTHAPRARRRQVVIYEGDPNCGAADRGAPTIYYANASFHGQFKWIIMVDDDCIVSTRNLARFLSAYSPARPHRPATLPGHTARPHRPAPPPPSANRQPAPYPVDPLPSPSPHLASVRPLPIAVRGGWRHGRRHGCCSAPPD